MLTTRHLLPRRRLMPTRRRASGHLVRLAWALVALVLALPPAAAGQTEETAPPEGAVDFGARFSSIDGDPARYQRYRDLRDGGFLDSFRYRRDTDEWAFDVRMDKVGYRDQRYQARYERFGRFKAWFEWDQIPLFYSADTRTLFRPAEPGVLRIDDAVQQSIESGATTIGAFAPLARQFDLRQRRDTARFGFLATPSRHLDLSLNLSTSARHGEMPWGASFGFNNAVEVAAPLEQRTTDLNVAAEWGNGQGSLRLQYDGSWFTNGVQTLVWDNPIKATDSTSSSAYVAGNGTSQGRMALWPDSTLHAVSVTGTLKLPRRSRATAFVSVGRWDQDQALLPHTINTAIPVIPLDRSTAEARALVTAMNLSYTTRPIDRGWFRARYRRYDFDNQTPHLPVDEYVRFDQVVEESAIGGTEPFGYVRDSFDADFSYDLSRLADVNLGYSVETVDRSFRLTEATTEQTVRVSLDSVGNGHFTARGVYEHGIRTGTGLDEEAFSDIGEQVSLRQFDISDRTRDRLSLIVQVFPHEAVGVSSSVGLGKDERPDALLGLQEARTRFYSLGVDVVPNDTVSAGITWGFDRYTSLQRSRQASPGPQFEDPTRDWSTDAVDRVHYLSAGLDVLGGIPRTDVRVAYDFNRSRGRYLYVLPANSSLGPIEQLPEVFNELHRATVDVQYFLTPQVAVGLAYWFDRYDVQDFALGSTTISRIDLPGSLLLGYVWRPYTAHTTWAHVSYLW